jgi:histidine triad (HIT) family protein
MNVLHEKGMCMSDVPGNRRHESATCAFCRFIRGEEQVSIVFEDSLSLAFLDHRPLFPGHCLLVPKEHFETLADFLAPLIGPLFQNAQLLERAIEEGLGTDGTLVALNNHVSQSVSHVHIHPRSLATGRMASKASSGPGNATRMTVPSDRCRKRFVPPLPGFRLACRTTVAAQLALGHPLQGGQL